MKCSNLSDQRKDAKLHCSSYCRVSLLLTAYKILSCILLSRFTPYVDEIIGIISADFDVRDQLLIRYPVLVRYRGKVGSVMGQYVSYLYTSRRPKTQLGEKYCTIFSLNLVYL
jgi:hypothetical protein